MTNDSRRGASNLGVPLMIVAFVMMGGLLYWLGVTAEPTEIVVIEDEPETDAFFGINMDAEILETPEITGYETENVRVADLAFAQQVGTASFFVSLPQGSPFLVRMDDRMRADPEAVLPTEGMVTVTGILYALTDSIRDIWEAEGTIDGNTRPLVDFSAHFISASQITPVAPAADSTAAPDEGGEG